MGRVYLFYFFRFDVYDVDDIVLITITANICLRKE